MERINGSLTACGQLVGNLVAANVIVAEIGDLGHQMSGELSAVGQISCTLGSAPLVTAELTLPKGKASPAYQGEYVVIPKAETETILQTTGFKMLDDVTVRKIPYYETSNPSGTTVYIANEV